MFAGGRYEFGGDLLVGAPIQRRSTVTGVEEKSGRSGKLVFVTVDHQLGGLDQVAVRETQDIVYRPPAPSGGAAGGAGAPAAPNDEAWDWELALPTDPTLLFRYSALTYNAHRIHYDRRYATEEEGYPGLVVHGPLQATAAAELCRRNVPEHKLRSFRFRAVRPAFDGRTLRVVGRLEADGENVTLAVLDHEGQKTVEAAATLQVHPGPG
jgi:3-methylfumaryl-CoA hydratase